MNPAAKSSVGAEGLMQFMPGTWAQVCKELGWGNVSRASPWHSAFAGVYYQAKMDAIWQRGRNVDQRHRLGMPSYNAGPGNIIAAQSLCHDGRFWEDIAICLSDVTGPINARQTINYGPSIAKWRAMMGPGDVPPGLRVSINCRWVGHRGGCSPLSET